MSEGKYIGLNPIKYEARKQLFSNVLGLDYIKGPTKTFNVKERLSAINDSLVDTVIKSTQALSPSKEYKLVQSDCLSTLVDLHLVAEFYLEIHAQAPKGTKLKEGLIVESFSDLSLYFKKQDDALATYFLGTQKACFVRKDANGKTYIELTAAGEKAFSEIWNCNDRHKPNDTEITFSKLKGLKKELFFEDPDLASIVDEKSSPSILVQNSLRSAGLTDEYIAPDESIVGSRRNIKGGLTEINF